MISNIQDAMEHIRQREGYHPHAVNEALGAIAMIEQQAMGMGANDYEPAAFASIKHALQSQELSPDEAVARAQGVLDSKQDYH